MGQIHDDSWAYTANVTSDGRLLVDASGTMNINNITGSIVIGSVSAHVDSIYVQSGDNINITTGSIHLTSGTTYTNVVTGSIQPFNNAESPLAVSGNVLVTGSVHLTSGTTYVDASITTDPVPVSGEIRTQYKNTLTDEFGRLKISEPFSLSDNVFKYDKDPLRWDEISTGSGWTTHVPAESAVQLQCGSGSGDSVTFCQRRYNRYQPGRGFHLEMTGVMGSLGGNTVRRWGLFDDNDGVFFEQSGTETAVVTRSSTTGTPTDTKVAQSSWNVDTVDGAGSSAFNLDVTKNNIYNIEFQWLSAGRVTFGLESDDPDQGMVIVHNTESVNALAKPYMKTATLPIRYEQHVLADNTGSATMKAICSTAIIEGGEDPPEFPFGAALVAEQGVGTTEEHLLSVRLSGTFKGIENRMIIIPRLLTAASETKEATIRLRFNSSGIGGTFASVDGESGMESVIGSVAFTGGAPIAIIDVGKDDSKEIDLSNIGGFKKLALSLNASGNLSDTLSVTGQSSAATANVVAGLTWGEVR